MTLSEILADTVAELERRGAPDEALATLRIPKFGRTKLVPTGRAWRLGVLLLTRDGQLLTTATVTRAVEPLRGVTNRSAEADARRQLRHVAAHSKFPEGEAINVDPVPLDVDPLSEPLLLEGDVVMIRWNGRDGIRPLADYLADRLALLDEG